MPTLVSRVVLYRLLIVTVVFAPSAAMLFAANNWYPSPAALGVAALVAVHGVLAVGYLAALLRWPSLRLSRNFLAGQYVVDAVLLAVPVAVTGGSESVFLSGYLLLVVAAGLTHSTRFGVTAALLSTALIVVVSYFDVLGVLPGGMPRTRAELIREVLVGDLTYLALMMALAVLSGGLAERLKRTGRDLLTARKDAALVRELYRLIVERIPSGVAMFDRNDRLVLLNESGAAIFGGGRQGIATRLRELRQCYRRGDSEATLQIGDHARRFGFHVSELDGDAGLVGWLMVFQDVTERKTMEAALAEQRRLASVGQLAANLAHELRNPLAGISNSLQLMMPKDATEHDEQGRLIEIQQCEINRLEALVRGFLEFARPSNPTPSEFDLIAYLRALIERLQLVPQLCNRQVHLHAAQDSCLVVTDQNLLEQVLNNVITNALQWTPEGKQVEVHVRLRNDVVVVEISDEGPGVPSELLGQIFDPFVSRRQGGTGLGLAIAWSALQSLQGMIDVDQAPQGGAIFRVQFPRVLSQSSPQHRAAAS